MTSALATRNPPPPTPEQRAKAAAAKGPSPLTQIVEIQAMLRADCLDPQVPAGYRAQAARAWDVLEERKRILRMKPKPRDIDVSASIAARKAKRLAPPLILEAPPTEEQEKESLP